MKNISALTRITVGLVSSMLGILMAAKFFGLLPDEERSIILGRSRVAECLAFTATAMIPHDDWAELNAILNSLVRRQDDLRSIGIRTHADGLVLSTAGHQEGWTLPEDSASTVEFMWVPLSHPTARNWGRIEFHFQPIRGTSMLSHLTTPFMVLLFFCAGMAFTAFRTFLKMVLKHLDPSRAVPRRVREALDILADGLMIVGLDDRILLANSALASVVGSTPEQLLGRTAASLGIRGVAAVDNAPWDKCIKQQKAITHVPMEIDSAEGTQSFNVNCSPLLGNEGSHRGVMVTFDNVTQLEQKKVQLRQAKDEA
ncbi:MAG: PAS domain-containing protein, partial [Planctomycetaceae bacterium]|nr:PAS domain-containing protein [Planctomycetaceae bacterium]